MTADFATNTHVDMRHPVLICAVRQRSQGLPRRRLHSSRTPLLRGFQANCDSHPLPHPGLWRRDRLAGAIPPSSPRVPRHVGAMSYSVSAVFQWMKRLGGDRTRLRHVRRRPAGPRHVVQLQVSSHVSLAVLIEGVQLGTAVVTWLTRDACLDHTGQSHELVHAFDASVALSNGHYGIGFGDGQYFGQLCNEGWMAVHSVQSGSAESARKLSEI
ncbi:hypothetical protein MRX96_009497 [Rhipicephalus microplus]